VTYALDTTVVIAALSPWHESHEIAQAACGPEARIPSHVLLEAYSVLTRAPEPFRVLPALAAEILSRSWEGRVLAPPVSAMNEFPVVLARAGVSGGATYDGLVALTARSHELTLLSLDRRAERTYKALGVEHRFIG
jgi:predicted nucleic acid-binding protein